MEGELEELNKGKRGRPYRYSNGLFTFSKIVKGFPVPDHSTIHRRLKASFPEVDVDGNMLIVDSTGFRMGRTTEYIEYRHKLRRRKKWIKLHIITDSKKVVRLIITKNNIGDSPAFREMFKTLKNELKDVNVIIADSAYDSRENFNLVAEYGIKPLIKVRKNPPRLLKALLPEEWLLLSKEISHEAKNLAIQKDGSWNLSSHLSKEYLVKLFLPANSFLDETFFRKEGSLFLIYFTLFKPSNSFSPLFHIFLSPPFHTRFM